MGPNSKLENIPSPWPRPKLVGFEKSTRLQLDHQLTERGSFGKYEFFPSCEPCEGGRPSVRGCAETRIHGREAPVMLMVIPRGEKWIEGCHAIKNK